MMGVPFPSAFWGKGSATWDYNRHRPFNGTWNLWNIPQFFTTNFCNSRAKYHSLQNFIGDGRSVDEGFVPLQTSLPAKATAGLTAVLLRCSCKKHNIECTPTYANWNCCTNISHDIDAEDVEHLSSQTNLHFSDLHILNKEMSLLLLTHCTIMLECAIQQQQSGEPLKGVAAVSNSDCDLMHMVWSFNSDTACLPPQARS